MSRSRHARLGTLESVVMKQVWRAGRATVREVLGAMPGRRKHAYTTILTALRNLEKKGYLRHETEGRTHIYIPRIKQDAVARTSVHDLLERFFDGSRVRMVAALLDENELTKAEFEALRRRILQAKEEEQGDA